MSYPGRRPRYWASPELNARAMANNSDIESDSDSEGGMLVEADEHGSHVPVVTHRKKQKAPKSLASPKEEQKNETSGKELESAMGKLTVEGSSTTHIKDGSRNTQDDSSTPANLYSGIAATNDSFSAFRSVRRNPREETGGKDLQEVQDVKKTIPALEKTEAAEARPLSYLDVAKKNPVATTGTSLDSIPPQGSQESLQADPSATTQPGSKYKPPMGWKRLAGKENTPHSTYPAMPLGNHAVLNATSNAFQTSTNRVPGNAVSSNTAHHARRNSSGLSKARDITTITDWRARSSSPMSPPTSLRVSPANATVGRSVSSVPKAPAFSSWASVASRSISGPASSSAASKPVAVVLPKADSDANRVAREMSSYRRFHGLPEESHFTPMEKVQEEQTGIARPRPMMSNFVGVDQSTAVYIKGLHAATTYTDLLENIHCGKIWHTYIDLPNPPHIPTAAAKIAFCTRAQAETFLSDIKTGRYKVRGQWVSSYIWDRRTEPERPFIPDTRCIQIQGPASMMEWAWFEREFTSKMDLKIIKFFEVPCDDETSKIFEIHFAGIFAQSRAVFKALETDFSDIYSFRYVPDPCEDGAY